MFFRDPLFNTRFAFIIRKGYGHIEKIDNELMWLDAFGLQDPEEEEIRRNTGIWVQDAGQCDLKEAKKPCKLPSSSKMYSWANREKVNPCVINKFKKSNEIYNCGLDYLPSHYH